MRAVHSSTVAVLTFIVVSGPTALLAQNEPDLTSTGNPTTAPLKWAGLLLNLEAVERDGKTYNAMCTAQFVSPRVVLTAAHCVQNNETGALYDINKMYFLLQYQNKDFSQIYRPVCLSRYNDWWPQRNSAATEPPLKDRAQWDYAMILMDRESSTGHYGTPSIGWIGQFQRGTATGYPSALLGGQIIQRALGELFSVSQEIAPNVVALKHNQVGLTFGSSGGAWVANFGKEEDAGHNVVIGLTSFVNEKAAPGVSFGPYLTSDFTPLFDYVSNGCPR